MLVLKPEAPVLQSVETPAWALTLRLMLCPGQRKVSGPSEALGAGSTLMRTESVVEPQEFVTVTITKPEVEAVKVGAVLPFCQR
jgi:hypothetical protein